MIDEVSVCPHFSQGYNTIIEIRLSGPAEEQLRDLLYLLTSTGYPQTFINATGPGLAFAEAVQEGLDAAQGDVHADDWQHVVPFTPSQNPLHEER